MCAATCALEWVGCLAAQAHAQHRPAAPPPLHAPQAVIAHAGAGLDPALISAVSAALAKAGLHERAGELAAHLGRPADALAAFRLGRAYRKAVELARTAAPAQVPHAGVAF